MIYSGVWCLRFTVVLLAPFWSIGTLVSGGSVQGDPRKLFDVVDDARKLDTFNARKVNSFGHPNSCRQRSAPRSAGCQLRVPSVGS